MPGVPAPRGQPLEPRPRLAGQDGAHTIVLHEAHSWLCRLEIKVVDSHSGSKSGLECGKWLCVGSCRSYREELSLT